MLLTQVGIRYDFKLWKAPKWSSRSQDLQAKLWQSVIGFQAYGREKSVVEHWIKTTSRHITFGGTRRVLSLFVLTDQILRKLGYITRKCECTSQLSFPVELMTFKNIVNRLWDLTEASTHKLGVTSWSFRWRNSAMSSVWGMQRGSVKEGNKANFDSPQAVNKSPLQDVKMDYTSPLSININAIYNGDDEGAGF